MAKSGGLKRNRGGAGVLVEWAGGGAWLLLAAEVLGSCAWSRRWAEACGCERVGLQGGAGAMEMGACAWWRPIGAGAGGARWWSRWQGGARRALSGARGGVLRG
jgi:hypothetical protein